MSVKIEGIIKEIEEIGNHIKSRAQLFEKFVKECPAPVCMVDPDFGILLYSNSFVDYFQIKEKDLLGFNILTLGKDVDKAKRFKETCESLKENQILLCEKDIIKLDFNDEQLTFGWKVQKFFLENGHRYLGGYILLCSRFLKEDGGPEWKIIET